MVGALGLSLAVIPLWAFGHRWHSGRGRISDAGRSAGAWGVIPVHLNEMSHDATRGLVPGLAYQLGILFAAPTNNVEFALRDRVGYRWALAGFETMVVAVLTIVTIAMGQERRGRSFVLTPERHPEHAGTPG